MLIKISCYNISAPPTSPPKSPRSPDPSTSEKISGINYFQQICFRNRILCNSCIMSVGRKRFPDIPAERCRPLESRQKLKEGMMDAICRVTTIQQQSRHHENAMQSHEREWLKLKKMEAEALAEASFFRQGYLKSITSKNFNFNDNIINFI